MRVRKKPWAAGYINNHLQYIVTDYHGLLGNWQQRFEKPQPLNVEVGTGKGKFIIEMAKRHPELNFIGIEIQTSVIATALRRFMKTPLPNLQFLLTNGANLDEIFEKDEVHRIFLNFSDPWPKRKHAKRRLTSPLFLKIYKHVLSEDGTIEFKTDNRGLFEYTLLTFNNVGMNFEFICLDLHNSPANITNVQTEYEEKFSPKGPIYKLIADFKSSK